MNGVDFIALVKAAQAQAYKLAVTHLPRSMRGRQREKAITFSVMAFIAGYNHALAEINKKANVKERAKDG